MKMNQLVFPLVLALVATLATTGCKKGFSGKVTQLPNHAMPVVTDPGLPPTQPFNPDANPNANPVVDPNTNKPGQNQLADRDLFEGMVKDPAALASYTVHFAFDSATVKKSEDSNISAVASALAASASDKLLIEGNCDERGTEEYNRSLGERRADALRESLVKAGVSGDRIRTISYGKDKPADPGHDDAAWAKNRRGDFILLHPKAGV
jgi:peptidoglycan-associated lipoprotein